jgi:hypothetical protein
VASIGCSLPKHRGLFEVYASSKYVAIRLMHVNKVGHEAPSSLLLEQPGELLAEL